MKKAFHVLVCTLLIMITVMANVSMVLARDVYVNGYYRSNGTYVQPHYRTSPNSTINDNYSTQGNVNPYTGKRGTVPRSPYGYSSPSYNYQNQYNPYR